MKAAPPPWTWSKGNNMVTQRQNAGGLVGGSILIGLGLLFLIGQYVGFQGFQYLWPFFIIGLGVAFIVGMIAGGKSLAPLAVPGSVLTTIGLLLLIQTIVGHWEAWAYGWTVIVTAVGIGIFIMGTWAGNSSQRQAGLRLAGIGLVLLVVFGSLFELVIFGGYDAPWRRAVVPVLLILAGLILLARRGTLQGVFDSQASQPAPEAKAADRPTPPSQP
jgi:hypothetical protein